MADPLPPPPTAAGAAGMALSAMDTAFIKAHEVVSDAGGLQCGVVYELSVVVERLVPCVASIVSTLTRAPADAVFAHVKVTAGREGVRTGFLHCPIEFPCKMQALIRRLVVFAVYRLLPKRLFAQRAAALVLQRLAVFPNRTDIDNDVFGALCHKTAEEHALAKEGHYRLPFIDLWQVLSPSTYLSDRVINFMIARLRSLCQRTEALRAAVHIPNSHFIVAARRTNDANAARRMFGLPCAAPGQRVNCPRLTLVVLHDPIGKHWSLAAVVRAQGGAVLKQPPYLVLICDSLSRAGGSKAAPSDVNVLRRWLAANAAGLEGVEPQHIPWGYASRLPTQPNNFDCALFVLATMHVFLQQVARERSRPEALTTCHEYGMVQWPTNDVSTLRRDCAHLLWQCHLSERSSDHSDAFGASRRTKRDRNAAAME